MAKKFRSLGNRNYHKWDNWEVGDFVVGKFVATYEDNFGNECYEIEVQETSMKEVTVGKTYGLGNGSMRYKMENVEKGSIIRVEYMDEGVISKGKFKGSNFHDVDVAIADEEVEEEVDTTDIL